MRTGSECSGTGHDVEGAVRNETGDARKPEGGRGWALRVRGAERNEAGNARTPEGGMGARAASCECSGTGTRQVVMSHGERSDTEQLDREQTNGERGQRERRRRG